MYGVIESKVALMPVKLTLPRIPISRVLILNS